MISEWRSEELCALMFGSFLADEKGFRPIFGKTEDLNVTIYGSYKGLKSAVMVTPQTAKQASDGFINTQNLDLFVEHKYQPEVVAQLRERIERDSLFVQSDLSREDIPVGDLHQFTIEALEGIELALDGSIRKVKTLQPNRVRKHG